MRDARFSRALGPLGLCSLWLLMIVLANPRGDFPLGDDWLFASAVRGLLETGEYRLRDLTMMTLPSQVLWGYGFSVLFGGFSFEVLRASTITLGLIAVLAGFSIAATHDYFAWNRARWEALRQLTSAGVSPASIDGGFEFNGTHLYSEDFQKAPGKSWWWVQDDEYIVAFNRIPGYRVVSRHPRDRWLFRRQEAIYTLRRLEERALGRLVN